EADDRVRRTLLRHNFAGSGCGFWLREPGMFHLLFLNTAKGCRLQDKISVMTPAFQCRSDDLNGVRNDPNLELSESRDQHLLVIAEEGSNLCSILWNVHHISQQVVLI